MSEELQEASVSLSAGFNKVRGIEAEETTPEQKPDAIAEPTPESTPEPSPQHTPEPTPAPEPSPDDEEIFPGITKGRAKELLAKVPSQEKAISSLAGKVGELVRTLKQNQPAQADGAPARKADAPKLARTGTEYPELAESLAEDLAALLPQSQDPKAVEALVQARLQEALAKRDQEQAEKELRREHKDWKDVVVSADFKLWMQGQPEDKQEEFASTWDPDVVGGYLSQFKTHRESLAKRRQHTSARLEGAVVPRGDGGAATSKLPDSAGLSAGFHKVRRPSP